MWSVVTESPRLSSTEAPTTLRKGGSSLVWRSVEVKKGGAGGGEDVGGRDKRRKRERK